MSHNLHLSVLKSPSWTSRVTQWMGVCLHSAGNADSILSRRIPHVMKQLSLCTLQLLTPCTLSLGGPSYEVHMPQLLKPAWLELCSTEETTQWEACAWHEKGPPLLPTRKPAKLKATARNKLNKQNLFFFNTEYTLKEKNAYLDQLWRWCH